MKTLTSVAVTSASLIAVLLLFVRFTTGQDLVVAPEKPKASLPIDLKEPLPIKVKSHPVEWRESTFHLVSLNTIQFSLDEESHLRAEVKGRVTMFDDVQYDVSAAVLNKDGELLGTARTLCEAKRMWLGRTMSSAQKLNLDFGVSLEYPNADSFLINISKRKVLTPDDWQK